MGKVKVLVHRVGQEPVVESVEDDLQTMQKLVGGYIEQLGVNLHLCIIMNEDGQVLPPNAEFNGSVICGDFFVARRLLGEEGRLVDITPDDVIECQRLLRPLGVVEPETPKSQVIKRIDLREFLRHGYLQEANRQFFHPLGLALEIFVSDDGGAALLAGVWDYRDVPEGLAFDDAVLASEEGQAKARRVLEEQAKRAATRLMTLGWVVQPVPGLYQRDE